MNINEFHIKTMVMNIWSIEYISFCLAYTCREHFIFKIQIDRISYDSSDENSVRRSVRLSNA